MVFKKMMIISLLLVLAGCGFSEEKIKIISLQECLDLARENNSDYRIKSLMLKQAEEQLKLAKSVRLPQANFDARYSRVSEKIIANISETTVTIPLLPEPVVVPGKQWEIGGQDNYSFKLGITQPIFTGFRISSMIKASENQVQSEAQNLEAELNQLIFQVKSAYYNFVKAMQLKEITETSLQVVQAHLVDVQRLYEQGMIAKNEVLKIEIKVSEIELAINKADHAISLSRMNLLNLIGLDLHTEIKPDANPAHISTGSEIENAFNLALTKRNELKSLDYLDNAAQNMIKVNKSEYYPNLSLTGFYEYGKPGLNQFDYKWMGYWAAGVGVHWNLCDWGGKKSKVAEAQVKRNQIIETKEKLSNLIQLDVQKAALKKDEAEKNITLAFKIKNQAEENLRLVKDQFNQGLVNNTEFLDAEAQLTKARIDELQAKIDYQIALADYQRAIGISQ